MKPTPLPPRSSSMSLVVLAFGGVAILLWGCGHTRQIVFPGRKVTPPRIVGAKTARSVGKTVSPLEAELSSMGPQRPTDAPTLIDVPIINPDGR